MCNVYAKLAVTVDQSAVTTHVDVALGAVDSRSASVLRLLTATW